MSLPVIPGMTPGSAVADQLQEILTNQRLEKRQAVIDAMNAQNVQSQMAARELNAKEQGLRIDALNRDREAQEIDRKTKTMSPHQNLDPATFLYLAQKAPWLIDQAQPAQPQFDYEGQQDIPAQPAQFHGRPEQLETERKNKEQADAMAIINDPEQWNKLDKVHKAMVYEKATGKSAADALFQDKSEWDKPVLDAEGNIVNYIPTSGATILPHPPKPDRPFPITPMMVKRHNDDTDEDENVLGQFDPNHPEKPYTVSPGTDGLRVANKIGTPPKTPEYKPKPIPPSILTGFNKAMTAALNNKGDETAQKQYTLWGNNVIDAAPVSDKVKAALKARWNDNSKRGIMPVMPPNPSKDAMDLNSVWTTLNPK